MFFSASHSAKMMDEITRAIKAKERAKLARLGLVQASPTKTTKGTIQRSPSSITSSIRSSGTQSLISDEDFSDLLDIDKKDVFRAEAKEGISKAIEQENERLCMAKQQMRRLGNGAIERYSDSKVASTIMMKQYKTFESKHSHILTVIENLKTYREEVESETDVKLLGKWKDRMRGIVDEPQLSVKYSDEELLNEVKSGKVKKHIDNLAELLKC